MSDERKDSRVRRLRPRRATPVAPARETAASVLPGVPRVGSLDALLREVDSLRLTLETDLTMAASAVEAGAPQIAIDIIDADRRGLTTFEDRALDHLLDLSDAVPAPRSGSRWQAAAPFVAAAAVVGFLVGGVPTSTVPASVRDLRSASASNNLTRLTDAAAAGETNNVLDAANDLHEQLEEVLAQAKTDPAAARAALVLLSAERAAIEQSTSHDSPALRAVLAQSARLSSLIFQALPHSVRTTLPTPAVPVIQPQPTPSPTAAPKPKPSPSASPAPAPSRRRARAPSRPRRPAPRRPPSPTRSPSSRASDRSAHAGSSSLRPGRSALTSSPGRPRRGGPGSSSPGAAARRRACPVPRGRRAARCRPCGWPPPPLP